PLERDHPVAVTVSLALLLFLIVVALLRSGSVTTASALTCIAFGFALASTGLAPAISDVLSALAGLFSI
ncbi:hypothetical protein, partial [Streptomyces sp. NPDC051016]|uniref:hypothetical protein n=1 Tax=Streptomyces sp. NPDC051016 TaxID=3365638 RepID=UPI0037A283DC